MGIKCRYCGAKMQRFANILVCISCGMEFYEDSDCCNEREIIDNEKDGGILSVHVKKAGLLSRLINNPSKVKNLMISGIINASDFNFLKTKCLSIQYLDLFDAKISSYIGSGGTNEGYDYCYESNEIPLGAFFYWNPVDEGMPSLKYIILPENIEKIARNAFARAYNLIDINFPKGLEKIGFVSFACCKNLKSIILPSTLKKIDDCAFNNCECLECVYIKANNPPFLGDNVFEGISKEAILIVPDMSCEKYENSMWGNYFKIMNYSKFSKI